MAYVDQTQQKDNDGQKITNDALLKTIKSTQFQFDATEAIKVLAAIAWATFVMVRFSRYSDDLAYYQFASMVLFGIAGAVMGRHKMNKLNGALLGFVFEPIGLVMAVYLKDRTRIPCPHCFESMKEAANFCPFCHKEV